MRKLFLTFALFASLSAQAAGPSRYATCAQLLEDEWLSQVVIQNLNQIANFPGNYAMAASQIMLQLIEHFQVREMDFAYFEKFLRQANGPLFLVANSDPLGPGLSIGYPDSMLKLKNGVQPLYHLWVGIKGQAEADALKRRLGISDEENLKRLSQTGFILLAGDMKEAAQNPNLDVADEKTQQDIKKVRVRRPFDPRNN